MSQPDDTPPVAATAQAAPVPMATPTLRGRRFVRTCFRAHGTLTWPPGLAAGLAFGSVILAIAGFSGGIVTLGTVGLIVLGLAIGFTGRLRGRLLLGLALWSAHAALAGASVLVSDHGVTAILPAVYVVLAIAAGQGVALIVSVLLYRADDSE